MRVTPVPSPVQATMQSVGWLNDAATAALAGLSSPLLLTARSRQGSTLGLPVITLSTSTLYLHLESVVGGNVRWM